MTDARLDLFDAHLRVVTAALEPQLAEQRETNRLLELLTKRRRRWF